eukprot:s1170_g3.t1
MVRAQWRRGGAFSILISKHAPATAALKQLKNHVCKTSAAYLLFRQKGILTNGSDEERYKLAKKDQEILGTTLAEEFSETFVEEDQGGAEAEYPEPPGSDPAVPVREPSREQKDALQRIHQNLGHPDAATLARTLRVGGAPEYLWKWAKQHCRCPACVSGARPKAPRPTAVPRSYAPNAVVAVDLFHMPSWDNQGEKELFLNMVDLGTNFQMIERIPSKEAVVVWKAMSRTWGRFLGWPQMILCDQGTEFLGQFKDKCHELGIILHTIGDQNGRCERHGALWKMLFERAKWINAPASLDEWKLLIRETEAAKNRLSDRSGFSPAQRMLGQTPRVSAELHSDSWLDPVLASNDEEMIKMLKARAAAQRAWAETNCSTVVRKALRARPRTQKQFGPGDVVYVWRHRAWEGPGVVIMPEGANCYVNVKGRLWKVANDHVRNAVSEEIKGTEAVHDVFRDLRERFSREGREAPVVEDLTGDPRPPASERPYYDPVEEEGFSRGLPRLRAGHDDPEPPVPLPSPEPLEPMRSATPEPPEPPVPQVPLGPDLNNETPVPREMERESTEEPEVEKHNSEGPTREDQVRDAVESANRGRRLDGIPMVPPFARPSGSSSGSTGPGGTDSTYEPVRESMRQAPHPYQRPEEDDVFVDSTLF